MTSLEKNPNRWMEVWVDTMGYAKCRGPKCGEQILWAELVLTGRKMCFDGRAVALRTRTDEATGREIAAFDFTDNHWRACADAERFKRGK